MASHAGVTAPAAVLCDFDGTLFDLALDLGDWWEWVGLHVPPGTPRTVERALEKLPERRRAEARERLRAAEAVAAHEGDGRPGAAAFLRELRAAAVPVAVVSSNYRATVVAGLRRLDCSADEVALVTRDDVLRPKPDPEPVLLALRALGVGPGQATLVGDSSHDVVAARAAGVCSCIVLNPRLPRPPVDGDLHVSGLCELLPMLARRNDH